MFFLLRQIRRELMQENKISTYLLYAVGEIILVVVGILIAVAIDDWNNEKKEQKQQVKYYKDILVDLKKDSSHFASRMKSFKRYIAIYYQILEQINETYQGDDDPFYDVLAYNMQFVPLTQKNQQSAIDKLKDNEIRSLLNEYFLKQESAQIALDEYNLVIYEFSRPFFLGENAFDERTIFQEDKYGFLPKGRVLSPDRMRELLANDRTMQILNFLRISNGFCIYELTKLIEVNAELIERLEKEIESE
jgi:hypothetical protein